MHLAIPKICEIQEVLVMQNIKFKMVILTKPLVVRNYNHSFIDFKIDSSRAINTN